MINHRIIGRCSLKKLLEQHAGQGLERVVERIVEVPVDRVVDRVVERIVEVPVDRVVEVPVDRVVEVPVEKVVERIVEKIVEVEKPVIVEIDRPVIVERIVEKSPSKKVEKPSSEPKINPIHLNINATRQPSRIQKRINSARESFETPAKRPDNVKQIDEPTAGKTSWTFLPPIEDND